jgi:hypothetical protein
MGVLLDYLWIGRLPPIKKQRFSIYLMIEIPPVVDVNELSDASL